MGECEDAGKHYLSPLYHLPCPGASEAARPPKRLMRNLVAVAQLESPAPHQRAPTLTQAAKQLRPDETLKPSNPIEAPPSICGCSPHGPACLCVRVRLSESSAIANLQAKPPPVLCASSPSSPTHTPLLCIIPGLVCVLA